MHLSRWSEVPDCEYACEFCGFRATGIAVEVRPGKLKARGGMLKPIRVNHNYFACYTCYTDAERRESYLTLQALSG